MNLPRSHANNSSGRRQGREILERSAQTLERSLVRSSGTAGLCMSNSTSEGWYIHKNGQLIGSRAFSELASLAAGGSIDRKDWVWRPGMSGWVAAETVDGLFRQTPPPLPLAPKPGSSAVELPPLDASGCDPRVLARLKRPGSVRTALVVMWATVVLSIAKLAVDPTDLQAALQLVDWTALSVIFAVNLPIYALLTWRIALGKNWARIVF